MPKLLPGQIVNPIPQPDFITAEERQAVRLIGCTDWMGQMTRPQPVQRNAVITVGSDKVARTDLDRVYGEVYERYKGQLAPITGPLEVGDPKPEALVVPPRPVFASTLGDEESD